MFFHGVDAIPDEVFLAGEIKENLKSKLYHFIFSITLSNLALARFTSPDKRTERVKNNASFRMSRLLYSFMHGFPATDAATTTPPPCVK
ncbi:hypothetical protein MJO29_003741 [Puccinia striiformis f. sp. tritici]|nr:hypothetical protein MJO29_003741 [Puccinia striiformis f. sp. tritici]